MCTRVMRPTRSIHLRMTKNTALAHYIMYTTSLEVQEPSRISSWLKEKLSLIHI